MPGNFKAQVVSDRMEQLKVFLVGRPNMLMSCFYTIFPTQVKAYL